MDEPVTTVTGIKCSNPGCPGIFESQPMEVKGVKSIIHKCPLCGEGFALVPEDQDIMGMLNEIMEGQSE